MTRDEASIWATAAQHTAMQSYYDTTASTAASAGQFAARKQRSTCSSGRPDAETAVGTITLSQLQEAPSQQIPTSPCYNISSRTGHADHQASPQANLQTPSTATFSCRTDGAASAGSSAQAGSQSELSGEALYLEPFNCKPQIIYSGLTAQNIVPHSLHTLSVHPKFHVLVLDIDQQQCQECAALQSRQLAAAGYHVHMIGHKLFVAFGIDHQPGSTGTGWAGQCGATYSWDEPDVATLVPVAASTACARPFRGCGSALGKAVGTALEACMGCTQRVMLSWMQCGIAQSHFKVINTSIVYGAYSGGLDEKHVWHCNAAACLDQLPTAGRYLKSATVTPAGYKNTSMMQSRPWQAAAQSQCTAGTAGCNGALVMDTAELPVRKLQHTVRPAECHPLLLFSTPGNSSSNISYYSSCVADGALLCAWSAIDNEWFPASSLLSPADLASHPFILHLQQPHTRPHTLSADLQQSRLMQVEYQIMQQLSMAGQSGIRGGRNTFPAFTNWQIQQEQQRKERPEIAPQHVMQLPDHHAGGYDVNGFAKHQMLQAADASLWGLTQTTLCKECSRQKARLAEQHGYPASSTEQEHSCCDFVVNKQKSCPARRAEQQQKQQQQQQQHSPVSSSEQQHTCCSECVAAEQSSCPARSQGDGDIVNIRELYSQPPTCPSCMKIRAKELQRYRQQLGRVLPPQDVAAAHAAALQAVGYPAHARYSSKTRDSSNLNTAAWQQGQQQLTPQYMQYQQALVAELAAAALARCGTLSFVSKPRCSVNRLGQGVFLACMRCGVHVCLVPVYVAGGGAAVGTALASRCKAVSKRWKTAATYWPASQTSQPDEQADTSVVAAKQVGLRQLRQLAIEVVAELMQRAKSDVAVRVGSVAKYTRKEWSKHVGTVSKHVSTVSKQFSLARGSLQTRFARLSLPRAGRVGASQTSEAAAVQQVTTDQG